MTHYNLSESAKGMTWAQWATEGGCNLSDAAAADAMKRLDLAGWQRKGYLTLGEVADASLLANRELARHAYRVLFKHAWVIVEVVDGQLTELEVA